MKKPILSGAMELLTVVWRQSQRTRQQPFVNQALAAQALALLGRLFWHGTIDYHGAFLNLASGKSTPLPSDPKQWQRLSRWNRRAA